jgi:membrane protein implicated in regulation of membrane protease activity
MFWIVLFLLGAMVAVLYFVFWLALMAFAVVAACAIVLLGAIFRGIDRQRRDRRNPWRLGGPRSASVVGRRELRP